MRSYLKSELLYALEHHLESIPFDEMLQVITQFGLVVTISSNDEGFINVKVTPEDAKDEEECNECNGCACEPPQETPNPFIAQHKQKRADMAKLGLSDFPYHEQYEIIEAAKRHIKEHKIEDKDEMVKVHHMMRDHYLKYKEHLKSEK